MTDQMTIRPETISVDYVGTTSTRSPKITLQVCGRIELAFGRNREWKIRNTIERLPPGIQRQVMSDMYRHLFLANYTTCDGKRCKDEAALRTLADEYEDNHTLPEFQPTSDGTTAPGMIVLNVLKHPGDPNYCVLGGILVSCLEQKLWDRPAVEERYMLALPGQPNLSEPAHDAAAPRVPVRLSGPDHEAQSKLVERADWATLRQVCNALLAGDIDTATASVANLEREGADRRYAKGRSLNELERTRVFVRDGFIDRYSGDRLVFPPVFPLISHYLPDAFPYHPNWASGKCHACTWNLSATVDHYVPLSFGGTNEIDNLYTTSMKRNLMKSKRAFEEMQWDILPPGDRTWDGLAGVFVAAVGRDRLLLRLPGFQKWYSAAMQLIVAA